MSRALAPSERRPLDAYYTPDALAAALVGRLSIAPGLPVLEPHVGGGAFARALRARGAHVTGIDLDPEAAGLADCDEARVGDFLTAATEAADLVVGNPPYRGFEAHLDRALEVAPRVAFLLRLAVLESRKRAALWARVPLERVIVLVERPSFTGGGTDSTAYGFFCFDRERREAPTIEWLSWRSA